MGQGGGGGSCKRGGRERRVREWRGLSDLHRPSGEVEGDSPAAWREMLPHLLPTAGRRLTRTPQ